MKYGEKRCSISNLIWGSFVVGLGLLVHWAPVAQSAESEESVLRDWTQYPVPHGVPKTPRPSDAEFLKILPPLNPVPDFDEESKALGMAPYFRDASLHIFLEQAPTPQELVNQPVVQVTAGDDEPLVLGLWGIRDVGEVTLKVQNSAFPISVRRVEFNPRMVPGENFGDRVKGGRMVGFANYLPLADTGEVKKDQNTVFWLTVETPKDAKPGTYQVDLQIGTADRPNAFEKSVPIEVLDYTLPRADIAFGFWFRANVDGDDFVPSHLRTPELMRGYWRDMARHGMTSASIYSDYRFDPLFDEEGNTLLAGNRDIQNLQGMMEEGLAHQDIPVMLLARVTAEAAPGIVAEAKKLGLPEFLLFGPDEPVVGNEGAKQQLVDMQPIRKHIRNITAISDYPAQVLGIYLDVWVTSSGRISPELITLAEERGAEMWTYDCNNKGTGNAPNSRFYSGLYTWALGLKGNFVWCYTEGYTWEMRHDAFFCHVIPTEDGPVPSIQWETRREGVKDYRTLRLLESLIARKPDHVMAREAQAWLDGVRYRVDWFRGRGVPPAMVGWDSIELWPACGNYQPSELSAVRAKAGEYILALKSVL